MKIALIGTGRMGFTQARIARAMHDQILWAADISADARASFAAEFDVPVCDDIQSPDYSQLDLLWITVIDSEIENIARSLPGSIPEHTVILHTSGALQSGLLKKHLPKHSCASFHPLMTCPLKNVPDESCVLSYRGVVHAFEGDEPATAVCRFLVDRLGGKAVLVQSDKKILYHAAAVFSANYPTVLIDISARLFEECGFSREQALESALGMCRQLIYSIEKSSPAEALTGPVKRNDITTIESHIHSLADYPVELRVYEVLKNACYQMLDRQ